MIKAIQSLYNQLPLAQHYTWDIPGNVPISIPSNISSAFDRNVYLKRNLHERLGTNHNWKDLFWIIQDWGGIKSLKNTSKNQQRIIEFFSQLTDGKLSKNTHSLLPSLSKLAAFKNPCEYSIYDSRAVYSLNWFLFCHERKPDLFPQPPSRNKALLEMDIQTLFRLSGRPYMIKSHKTAYFEYCTMLKDLSVRALQKTEPFYLEMLLFVAAENWVPNDIRNRTTVTIR